MKDKLLAFKILKRKGQRLYSAMVEGKGKIRYYENGRFICPHKEFSRDGYGLTVFKTFISCRYFCEKNLAIGRDYEIWLVEINRKDLIEDPPPPINLGNLKWTKWPEGTLVVKKLKLVRQIARDTIFLPYEFLMDKDRRG